MENFKVSSVVRYHNQLWNVSRVDGIFLHLWRTIDGCRVQEGALRKECTLITS